MEYSRNYNMLPMKGTIEREERRRVEKARQVRLVVQALQQASMLSETVQIDTTPAEQVQAPEHITIDNL